MITDITAPLTRRWSIVRASTGKVVRSFSTRTDARNYKRVTPGNFRIMDNWSESFVR